jgi:hypothetical protein
MSRAVVIAMLAGACAAPAHSPSPALGQPAPPRGGTALGVFPPNATRVTATVQKVNGDTLTLEIHDVRQARPDLPMGPAYGTLTAVSRESLSPGLAGRRIEATVTLVGDTQKSQWFVSEIRTLP